MNAIDWQDLHAVDTAARHLRDFCETGRENRGQKCTDLSLILAIRVVSPNERPSFS